MKRPMLYAGFLALGLATGFSAGCAQGPAQSPTTQAPPKPPEVITDVPVRKEVADYEDTTGQIKAIRTVEVRARVTGYLKKVNFKEGTEVKENEVLFEIDARPYEAELARAEAAVNQAQSRHNRLLLDFQRATNLRNRNAIGQEELDKITSDRDEAEAAVKSAGAARDMSKLNVEFTKVRADVTGIISSQWTDPGNMVKADETPLTIIVTKDPVYAYFDVDERTLLRLRRLIEKGQLPASPESAGMKVLMGLADEDGFPNEGTINFVDNRVDTTTGTMHLRAIVPNKNGILSPGLFVRIRVPIGEPRWVILIPEEAIGTDQGRKFVYVIDSEDKAQTQPIKVGKLYDGLRVVTEGLKGDERIVVDGLQRVRQNFPVTPKPVEKK